MNMVKDQGENVGVIKQDSNMDNQSEGEAKAEEYDETEASPSSGLALPAGLEYWKEGNNTNVEDISEMHDCFCPMCHGGNAKTMMLPTRIPMFREIIIMSLTCPDCHFKNSEISFGGTIQPQGERVTFHIHDEKNDESDSAAKTNGNNTGCWKDRQIIKSDSASIIIPHLQFEIPPKTQKGVISTLEGVIKTAADTLEELQPERLRLGDVDNFHRCRHVIHKLRSLVGCNIDSDDDDEEQTQPQSFDIILDDPAGNSYIEACGSDPLNDPTLTKVKYARTPNQDMDLGLQPSMAAREEGCIRDEEPSHSNVSNAAPSTTGIEVMTSKATSQHSSTESRNDEEGGPLGSLSIGRQEVMKFPSPCPSCTKPAETDMCVTDIPHFKEVIIMSLFCEHCGFKSNEVKGGGGIPKFGTKITIKINSSDDLAREVLKSDTAGIEIPELELELDEGGLNGLYTTIEGLMNKLHDRLKAANPFGVGDSASKHHIGNDGDATEGGKSFSGMSPVQRKYAELLQSLSDMQHGKLLPFTLVISDPLSNSFVGPIPRDAIRLALQAEKDDSRACYDCYIDSGMVIEEYERSNDQNDILGLSDMKVEGYDEEGNEGTKDNNQQAQQNYGTDQMEELPDRLRKPDIRGPDHPHVVGMAPVQGDVTVMGPQSVQFAVPGLVKRGVFVGKKADDEAPPPCASEENDISLLSQQEQQVIIKREQIDKRFISCKSFCGSKEGMVFKSGAQGLGYYTDF